MLLSEKHQTTSQAGIVAALAILLVAGATPGLAQQEGQSRESMALDNTASQWSFEFVYQAGCSP